MFDAENYVHIHQRSMSKDDVLPLRSGTKRPQQVMAPLRLNCPKASSM